MRVVAFLLAVAALLAGCAADSPATTSSTSTTVTTSASATLVLPYPETGCTETIGVVLVDFATAAKALPKGLSPRDASGLLGLPIPAGKAALFVNAVTCPDGGEAAQAVLVETPKVANLTLPASTLDFYQLAYSTGNATHLRLLQDFGVPVFPLDAQLTTVNPLPETGVASEGQATVNFSGQLAHQFQSATAGTMAETVVARFWTQTPQGLALIDYDADTTAEPGTLASCTLGGPLAAATGVTSCDGMGTASLHFPDQGWDGTLRLVPGATFS